MYRYKYGTLLPFNSVVVEDNYTLHIYNYNDWYLKTEIYNWFLVIAPKHKNTDLSVFIHAILVRIVTYLPE